MGVRLGNISEGRTIAINSADSQVLSDQPPAQPKQPFGLGRGGLIQSWQKFKPMRRAKSGHAPTLLINQNRRMPAHGCAQLCAEVLNLLWSFKIARKENKAIGLRLSKETALCGRQRWALAAKNQWRQGHDGPCPSSSSQNSIPHSAD
jgi:hypothetical protein